MATARGMSATLRIFFTTSAGEITVTVPSPSFDTRIRPSPGDTATPYGL